MPPNETGNGRSHFLKDRLSFRLDYDVDLESSEARWLYSLKRKTNWWFRLLCKNSSGAGEAVAREKMKQLWQLPIELADVTEAESAWAAKLFITSGVDFLACVAA